MKIDKYQLTIFDHNMIVSIFTKTFFLIRASKISIWGRIKLFMILIHLTFVSGSGIPLSNYLLNIEQIFVN